MAADGHGWEAKIGHFGQKYVTGMMVRGMGGVPGHSIPLTNIPLTIISFLADQRFNSHGITMARLARNCFPTVRTI